MNDITYESMGINDFHYPIQENIAKSTSMTCDVIKGK